MNLEMIKRAKEYIEKMANGINPLTGKTVPDNDLINNIKISRCLFYVNSVLEEVLTNGSMHNKKAPKIPFHLTKEELDKFNYSDEDLSISRIVKKFNDLKPNENMVNLRAPDVCKWLINVGLLVEFETNGKKVKIPTETGKNMGMYTEHRVGMYNEYDIVIYKKPMQEFLVDNFDQLLEFINNLKTK